MAARVLLVEDDAKIASMLDTYLQQHDFVLQHVGNLADARTYLQSASPDIVVLDMMLPDGDGMLLCRELRAQGSIPIVILTARGDPADRVLGLELGADDYVAKPFDPRELVARLRSVLRRARPQPNKKKLRVGDLQIDKDRLAASFQGKALELTAHQFTILRVLAERVGRVQSREQLMEAARGESLEAFDRSIDVHISRIRAALGDDPKKPRWIKTVRGAGYVLTPPTDPK